MCHVFLHVYHLKLIVDKESDMSHIGKLKQTWMTKGNNYIYQLPRPTHITICVGVVLPRYFI